MKKVYYTIEPSKEYKNRYVLWRNTENIKDNIGVFGCYNVLTGFKKEIKKYCRDNRIRVKGGLNGCFSKI